MNFNKNRTIKNKNNGLRLWEMIFFIILIGSLIYITHSWEVNNRTENIEHSNIITQTEAEYKEFKVNSNWQAQEVPRLEKEDWEDRMDEMLLRYGRDEDLEHRRWNRVWEKHGIKPPVLVCIAKADSSLGRELKSSHNYWNVGNNDRGDVVHFGSSIAGIDAMGRVLNNKYLGHKQSIGSLSVWGGGDAPYYATSPENWNNNVINCLRAIYNDYTLDEDFMFRL